MAMNKKTRRTLDDVLSLQDGSSRVGLGIDIVEIERMRAILQRTPSFARRVFSSAECAYCDSQARPEVHYAMRFAAKEAILKALGCGFGQGIAVRDIEVKRSFSGKPSAALSGRAYRIAVDSGIYELPLSLSYTRTTAIACALAITKEAHEQARLHKDAGCEAALQFKQARDLIDDLSAVGTSCQG